MKDILASGHWWQSGNGAAEELEEWLARQHAAVGSVGVANGTVALEVAFRALGIGPGDEVLVPAATFISTASAVSAVGGTPVPVDVSPLTWCVDPDKAASALSPRTRALVAVHLAGHPADLDASRAFCNRHSLALVEDSAQATTASWGRHRVGTVGDVSTFSFQAAKLLPGGEGGAIVVKSDSQLARRVELLANCGRPRGSAAYDIELIGTNARISEFSAAAVMAHTEGYEDLWQKRAAGAAALTRRLNAVDPSIALETDPNVTRHDWYMYLMKMPTVLVESGMANSQFAEALRSEGIPASVMYPAWHTTPAYGGREGHTPAAERAGTTGVWLHHRLLLDDRVAQDVADAVSAICAHDTENRPTRC